MNIADAENGKMVRHTRRGIGRIDYVFLTDPRGHGELSYGTVIDPGPFPQMGVTFSANFGAAYNANEIRDDFELVDESARTWEDIVKLDGKPLHELLDEITVKFWFEESFWADDGDRDTVRVAVPKTLTSLLSDFQKQVLNAFMNTMFTVKDPHQAYELDEFDDDKIEFESKARGVMLCDAGKPYSSINLVIDGYRGLCEVAVWVRRN